MNPSRKRTSVGKYVVNKDVRKNSRSHNPGLIALKIPSASLTNLPNDWVDVDLRQMVSRVVCRKKVLNAEHSIKT